MMLFIIVFVFKKKIFAKFFVKKLTSKNTSFQNNLIDVSH